MCLRGCQVVRKSRDLDARKDCWRLADVEDILRIDTGDHRRREPSKVVRQQIRRLSGIVPAITVRTLQRWIQPEFTKRSRGYWKVIQTIPSPDDQSATAYRCVVSESDARGEIILAHRDHVVR